MVQRLAEIYSHAVFTVSTAIPSQAVPLPGGVTLPPQQIPEPDFEILPWLAVIGAWICFGSFAVPMKSKQVMDAGVNPIIFQCYKTFWAFASSFLVLFFQPFEFTWWGIASGFSWVPAGIAAVIAVQNIGIACGQAIWQVTILGTWFMWRFLFLRDERVYNWWGTALALMSLIIGVLGMTVAFNMPSPDYDDEEEEIAQATVSPRTAAASDFTAGPGLQQSKSAPASLVMSARMSRRKSTRAAFAIPGMIRHTKSEAFDRGDRDWTQRDRNDAAHTFSSSSEDDDFEETFSVSYPFGVAAAVFNGTWGGTNLVPSHFSNFQGVHYVISFGIGALVANAVVLLCLWIYKQKRKEPFPRIHLRVMMLPGFISGMLWSMGNFCALYAVSTLGQGIGYSLVQASIIVSGLWGILYYREMAGRPIVYWAFACALCGVGVAGLALEKAPMATPLSA